MESVTTDKEIAETLLDRHIKCPMGDVSFRQILLKKSLLKRSAITDSISALAEAESMMGSRQTDQAALFYSFSLERHVPALHLLRAIDRFVELSGVRSELAPFYSSIGRPSIDPELLVRMW
jgi:hypothetical protein